MDLFVLLCHMRKPLTEEQKSKNRIYRMAYYEKNKDRELARAKEYANTHRKEVSKKHLEYVHKNKDKIASYQKEYAKKNPDKVRAAELRRQDKEKLGRVINVEFTKEQQRQRKQQHLADKIAKKKIKILSRLDGFNPSDLEIDRLLTLSGEELQVAIIQFIKLWIRNKKSDPCVDCNGNLGYLKMEYDHVRGEKLFEISRSITFTRKHSIIQSEIDKCDLVCKPCHSKRTSSRHWTNTNVPRSPYYTQLGKAHIPGHTALLTKSCP